MSEQITLKERMETRKENYLLRLETHYGMFNETLSQSAPVLSQLVSAMTVGYATYEGVMYWLNMPFIGAIIIGFVAAAAVESVGFMSVDERDQSEAHNRRVNDQTLRVDVSKAREYVDSTFWIVLSIVAITEAIPAMLSFYDGTMMLPGVIFRCGLLLFPFLSRLGANLYAARSVRLAAQQAIRDKAAAEERKAAMIADEDREFERMKRQADLDAYKAKLQRDADLERERALTELRIREKKADAKLSEAEQKKVSTTGRSVDENFPESVQKVSSGDVGKRLVLYYKDNPGAKLEDAAQHVGWSVPAVSKEISSLVDVGVFHAEKQGRRKVITVNGNHEAYLAS